VVIYSPDTAPHFLDDIRDNLHSSAMPPRRHNVIDFLRFTPPPIVSPTSTRSNLLLHSCSLNVRQSLSPHHPLSLHPLSHHAYTSCQSGGPLIRVMTHALPHVVDVPLTRGDQVSAMLQQVLPKATVASDVMKTLIPLHLPKLGTPIRNNSPQ